METISDVAKPMLSIIGEIVLIGNNQEFEVYGFSTENGWLVIGADGKLEGEGSEKPDALDVWNPGKEAFPKKRCLVFMPDFIIWDGNDSDTVQMVPDVYEFAGEKPRKVIDGIIDQILKLTPAKIEEF